MIQLRALPVWLGDKVWGDTGGRPRPALTDSYFLFIVVVFVTAVLLWITRVLGIVPLVVEQVFVPAEALIWAVVLWRLVPSAGVPVRRFRTWLVILTMSLAGMGIWDLPVSWVIAIAFCISLWRTMMLLPAPGPPSDAGRTSTAVPEHARPPADVKAQDERRAT